MNDIDNSGLIQTEEELRELLGYPSEVVKHKSIDRIDRHCVEFIAHSPFLVLSTSDDSGRCDASPRGDQPGFVHVIDEKHLVLPERPGNRRIDSLRNILSNPHVGLLFLIPGLGETLRINGRASLTRNEKLLRNLAAHGRIPAVGIIVEVEECYLHCAKAFIRSQLWKPESWQERLPSPAAMLVDHVKVDGMTIDKIASGLEDSYKNRLY